jgi:uncharacterized protein YbaR (Trm112 family)
MNTHTFDNHYVTCPICQRNATPKPIKTCVGLFSCPYCQEKLVVCQSGHYVRDPFTLKQMMISSALRRQSSPLARIIRDFVFLKRPVVALAVGSVMILSMIAMTQQSTSCEQEIVPKIEKIDKKSQ